MLLFVFISTHGIIQSVKLCEREYKRNTPYISPGVMVLLLILPLLATLLLLVHYYYYVIVHYYYITITSKIISLP